MNLTICNTTIDKDSEGRFRINDIHEAALASGVTKDIRPNEWMALDQTNGLIEILITENPGSKPTSSKAGRYGGTYVVKELVYAHAMWISAKFHLHVIRAFDALVTGKAQPATDNSRLAAELMFAESAAKILRLPESGKLKLLGTVARHHELPEDLLPAYAVDAPEGGESSLPTFSLSALLEKHGKPMAASSMNKRLQEAGFIEKLYRKASNGDTKWFWSITEKGLPFGKNLTNHASQRETQPHWYIEKFTELLKLVAQ